MWGVGERGAVGGGGQQPNRAKEIVPVICTTMREAIVFKYGSGVVLRLVERG